MTIRFVTAWNGYYPDQIVSSLGSTEETRLIGLGYAVADIDGPGNTPLPVYATKDVTGGLRISAPQGHGKTVALLGDSITANNNLAATYNSQTGYWTHASILLGKRFASSPALNFGVSGETSAQILARVGTVILAQPDVCVVLAGTNDVAGGVSAENAYANIAQIWKSLTSAGISVVAGTVFPRSDAPMTPTYSKVLQRLNNLIRLNAPKYVDVHLWDAHQDLADMTSTVSGCISTYFSDNLHPNRLGAYWAGKSLAAVFNKAFPTDGFPAYRCVSGGDLFDATYAPTGNLLSNALLAGTGGTNAGAYATGSVANSFTVYRGLGSTITCVASKGVATLPNGQTYPTQILTVSTPGGGVAVEEIAFFQNVTTAVGDSLIGGFDIDIASISGKLNYVTPRVQAQYASYSVLAEDAKYYAGSASGYLPEAFSGHTQSTTGIAPAGGTSTQFAAVVSLDCTVASSVQVTIGMPYLRKI